MKVEGFVTDIKSLNTKDGKGHFNIVSCLAVEGGKIDTVEVIDFKPGQTNPYKKGEICNLEVSASVREGMNGKFFVQYILQQEGEASLRSYMAMFQKAASVTGGNGKDIPEPASGKKGI